MHLFAMAAMSIAALTMAPAASAQTVTASNPQSVVAVIEAAGLDASLEESDGSPVIRSSSKGSRFSIYFLNCDDGRDCVTVQFYAGYKSDATLEQLNEWNAAHRFARGYLREGSARLEMDIDLDAGGMSAALFGANVESWTALMAEFEAHIGH